MTMKRILFALIFMVFSLNSQTSDSFDGALNIVGWVYSDDKPLRGAEVLVLLDNVTVAKHMTNRHGRFIIDLPLGDAYTLSISNPGLVGKNLLFDTQIIPQQTINSEFYFDFVLDLFESIPWIDKSLLEAPLITIAFDQLADNFTYNQVEYELLRYQLDAINMVAAMYETKGQEYRNLHLTSTL